MPGITQEVTGKGESPRFVWASYSESALRRHGIPAEDGSRPLCIRCCVVQNVGLELLHLFRSPV